MLLPLVAFAALGSSRYLVVAADSATAAILAGGLATRAVAGSEHYLALAGLVALLAAGFLLLARFFRLGFLADFLSRTLLVGFLTGVGFHVGIAVLGEMLRLLVRSTQPAAQLFEVLRQINGGPRARTSGGWLWQRRPRSSCSASSVASCWRRHFRCSITC